MSSTSRKDFLFGCFGLGQFLCEMVLWFASLSLSFFLSISYFLSMFLSSFSFFLPIHFLSLFFLSDCFFQTIEIFFFLFKHSQVFKTKDILLFVISGFIQEVGAFKILTQKPNHFTFTLKLTYSVESSSTTDYHENVPEFWIHQKTYSFTFKLE